MYVYIYSGSNSCKVLKYILCVKYIFTIYIYMSLYAITINKYTYNKNINIYLHYM